MSFETELVWRNIVGLFIYHVLAIHGLYYLATSQVSLSIFIWQFALSQLGGFGVICGMHRLWTHRTYKAKKPLRILWMLCSCIANQNSIYVWSRDHRVHHKFSDTDADPHNIKRGFFFAHMGWLMCRKHPDVLSKGSTIDTSDLLEDEVVAFQHKYFEVLAPAMCWAVPTLVPWYYWNERFYLAVTATMFRYVLTLHGTWLVNSAAHLWGTKPYDAKIIPVENLLVSYITGGEGFHNYHHVFPFDYKAAELDTYNGNVNTALIDFMAKIGWAYDLKTATPEMVNSRKLKNEEMVKEAEADKEMVFGIKSAACKTELVWRNVVVLFLYHVFTIHGLYYLGTLQMSLLTFFWQVLVGQIGTYGIICGAHRLWTHRSYKATKPLRILLMLLGTIANQNSIYIWARDHRVHHKFSDTDADPHNIKRGFFFAHMGWLMVKKHPDVTTRGSTVDVGDVWADEVVRFQHKYYLLLAPTISLLIPTLVPWYFWNEGFYIAFTSTMARYILALHGAWLVNSAAHTWGTKPYDGRIKSVENLVVSYITNGEGFHNYHHVFPFDYKAAELDTYNGNLNTAFIDLMAKIGWAYDLKTATPEMVKSRKLKNEKIVKEEETGKKMMSGQECKDTKSY